MFKVIQRWLKAISYVITFRIGKARNVFDTDPDVIRTKYNKIIVEKTKRFNQYKKVISGLLSQHELKSKHEEQVKEEIKEYENLKEGALHAAKEYIEKLQKEGKELEEIHQDETYLRHYANYDDFMQTLMRKQNRLEETQSDVKIYKSRADKHTLKIERLVMEIRRIKLESDDVIADLNASIAERKLAGTFAGILKDDEIEKDLQEMQEVRQKIKINDRITAELSGDVPEDQENEFLGIAARESTATEFDSLIGLTKKDDDGVDPNIGENHEKEI